MDVTGLTPLLIDAKREYVGQLTDAVAPYVVHHMHALLVAAAQQHRSQATLAFQHRLREIPHWNATSIEARTAEIQSRYPFLADLIAACFVAYVKILSSVKLHQHKPNIRLRLPSNDTFVHKVYVNVAREFYANPGLARADKATKTAVVRAAVEAAVRDMLPIQDILKAYLGNTVDAADRTMNPGEMADDDLDSPQLAPPFEPSPAAPPLPSPPPPVPGPTSQSPDHGLDPSPNPPSPHPGVDPSPNPGLDPSPHPEPSHGLDRDDDLPKQISLSAVPQQPHPQLRSQSLQPQSLHPQPQPQPQPQYDFFSDAEDDF